MGRSREKSAPSPADRNVFFFVSGGVDSTVAYTLCLRALGPDRVYGIYVDTGLMREGETAYVRAPVRATRRNRAFAWKRPRAEFLSALEGVTDPETKRHIIGEQFVVVQERILSTGHFLDGHWILGQGTIYPDTIESGGTAKADVIKTHHNRVAGIQKLIETGRIIEPLVVVLQRRSARDRRGAWHSGGVSASASISRTRAGDSLLVFGNRSAGRRAGSRLAAADPFGWSEGRFAQLSFGAGAENNSREMRSPPSW